MPNLKLKTFTRAHFEIKHRRKELKHMQNFDNYNEIQMKKYSMYSGKVHMT
jgi:RNA-directed DNA polymerase